jgi:hypothetical protein
MKPGKYIGKAVGIDFGRTKNGNEYIAVEFDVAGEVETWSGYFSDKAVERTISSLRQCGWTGNDVGAITVQDLPGYVVLDVRQDVDQDKRPRVDAQGQPIGRIAFVGSQVIDPLDGGARKALGLRLRGACARVPVVEPVLAPPQPMREPGDDVPF